MIQKEQRYSPTVICKHCGNSGPMLVRTTVSEVESYEGPQGASAVVPSRDEGLVYDVIKCPACTKISLASYYWHDAMDPDDVRYDILYPSARHGPVGLPDVIGRAYSAAHSVKAIDANAYGVLLGRVLELVCIDRSADGKFLSQQLKDLAKKGEIPAKLVKVADGLRALRNVGAHPGLGELTDAEVPILEELTRAILEYVYTAPLLASQAEARLKELKARSKAHKS